MPRKIRELKADLQRAGFIKRPGKGSHTVWSHHSISGDVAISGNDGDDARHYQENDVEKALQKLRNAQRRQP